MSNYRRVTLWYSQGISVQIPFTPGFYHPYDSFMFAITGSYYLVGGDWNMNFMIFQKQLGME